MSTNWFKFKIEVSKWKFNYIELYNYYRQRPANKRPFMLIVNIIVSTVKVCVTLVVTNFINLKSILKL